MDQTLNSSSNNNNNQTQSDPNTLKEAVIGTFLLKYGYNLAARRYVAIATGRFVSEKEVRAAVDVVIAGVETKVKELATSLQSGQISLAQWQMQTALELKQLHVASGVAANGGFANCSQADFGYIGSLIKKQYEFLNNFAQDIATGKQLITSGTFVQRVKLYAQAARGIYEEMKQRAARIGGATQERRILGVADHCPDCLAISAKDWQPIGSLPAIGSGSVCLTNCHCTFDFR